MLNDSTKTLLGVICINMVGGALTIWGSVGLYILSYFHKEGAQITKSTNSIIIIAIMLPLSIVVLWAAKLSNRFGHEKVIKICAVVFFISPQLSNFSFTLFFFTLFCVLFPASAFAICSVPVLNCLWTQYPRIKHIVTSMAVVCFALGAIFWNAVFTMTVNPQNQSTIINDQSTGMQFYGQNVTDNVRFAIKYGFLICGLILVCSSFLIKRRNSQQVELQESHDHQQHNKFKQRNSLSSIQSLNIQPKQLIHAIHRSSQINTQQHLISNECEPSLKQVLMSLKFLSIFSINLMSSMFQIFVNLNIKIIYMSIVRDDHFLAYCAMLGTLASILAAFVWGFLGDHQGFYRALVVFTVLDFVVKIYGCFCQSKITIMLMFILLGISDKGMATMMGPGLVEIFGLEMGTELLPFKGLSMFLGFLFSPLIYIILSSYLSPRAYMRLLLVLSLACVLISLNLLNTEKQQNKQSRIKKKSSS